MFPSLETVFETIPTLYPMGTGGSFPGSKATEHLVPRSKNTWSYTSIPPIRLHCAVLS